MSGRDITATWETLRQRGLVADTPPPRSEMIRVPWYVRVISGISGWIAALFLLAVIPIGFGQSFDDGWPWLVVGGLSCLLAWFLDFRGRSGDFAAQFAFALSVAGQIQLLLGLHQLTGWDLRALGWVVVGLELLLFFAIAGPVHRVWTVVAGGLALLYLIGGLEQGNLLLALGLGAFALVWLNEFNMAGQARYLHPLGYGLLLLILILVVTGAVDMGGLRSDFVSEQGLAGELLARPLLGAMAVGAVVVVATAVILGQQAIARHQGVGLALLCLGLLVATTALFAPGIGAAYLVILVGRAHDNRLLLGIGVFGLLGYLGHYYYALELALLYKSAVLVASGVVLLLARLLFRGLGLTAGGQAADVAGDA